MTERELLKLALEALEAHADIGIKSDKVITAIKEALAQPEQEPVCVGWDTKTDTPIFITPPQRKPLTDEQKDRLANAWFSKDGDTDVAHRKAIALIKEVEAAHGIKENT